MRESGELAALRVIDQSLLNRQQNIQKERAVLNAEEQELGDKRAALHHEIGELMMRDLDRWPHA